MKQTDLVLEFEESRKRVAKYFGCDEDFFLKPLLQLKWAIKNEEDFHFLSYWSENGKKTDAVIVRKNGIPMVYHVEDYTMVVAIDCVKIGFIFANEKKNMDIPV